MANNMLAFLDMMSGISIVFERGQYAFAIGKCGAMLNVLNSPFFVIADKLEMEETAL